MAIDQFANWRKRLKGETVPTHDGEPDPGFYRNRNIPVAYWYDNFGSAHPVLCCHIDGKTANNGRPMQVWPFASKEPVTKAAYDEYLKTGTWPDQHPAVTLSNNAPLDDNSIEGLTAQINMLANEADMLMGKGAAKTQTEADHAADVAIRLGELWGRADSLRKIEKQPHYDKAVAVENKWRPLLDVASIYSRIKAIVCKPFIDAENARRQKAQDDAIAAAAERARQQREADDAARIAAETTTDHVEGSPADAAAPMPAAAYTPPPPAPIPAFKPASAGTRGRKVSSRSKKVARITDYAKALDAFKDHPNIKDEVQRLANAQAKLGMPTAGCEIVDEGAVV